MAHVFCFIVCAHCCDSRLAHLFDIAITIIIATNFVYGGIVSNALQIVLGAEWIVYQH